MAKNKDSFFKGLFLVAAIYDLLLGLAFLSFYKPIYSFFNITLPTFPMYLQLSAAFVIAMGVGYYLVFLNLRRNIDLVKLGIIYKFTYIAVVSYFFLMNLANIAFMYFVLFDAIFLATFVWFLVYAKTRWAKK